ncbi:MAG: DUF2996 domain-containing protein, partial [Cyanobacteria bacterium P01_H01_bin.121]
AKKPAVKPRREKPPAPEDKPFTEFIEQHYVPALEKALADEGITDLTLTFEQQALPVIGDTCWQVRGQWLAGQRSFLVAFPDEAIKGQKVFASADGGSRPTTLEAFLGDERRVNLDLLVFGVVRRLNGQKWLGWN